MQEKWKTVLIFLIASFVLTFPVSAAGSSSLSIVLDEGQENIHIPTASFYLYAVDTKEESPEASADDLLRRGVKGIPNPASKTGSFIYEDLSPGTYLIVQIKEIAGYEKINPFYINLPRRDSTGEAPAQNFTAYPKFIIEQDEGSQQEAALASPTRESGRDSDLIQTGPHRWLFFYLVIMGMTLLSGGLLLKKKIKEDSL